MATVEFLKTVRPELRWTPEVREQALAFRARKSIEFAGEGALEKVIFEAQTILGRCVPPQEREGNDTGLVVGYVQSGKTLSFTTVIALARDNGYRLIILLAGVATNLKSQSERRLLRDLGVEDGERAWAHFENPNTQKEDVRNIQNVLGNWRNEKVPPRRRRTVIVTVLKHHTRLSNLVSVLSRLDLTDVPALIIDDEADQASLNAKAAFNRRTSSNAKTPTYDWITQLKGALPHHTLLQYTATPQANLLIHLADVLSPSFAELVSPGDGYVGGRDFFTLPRQLVSIIPFRELPSPTNPLNAAPSSLQRAIKFFLLGAAVHYSQDEVGNRSMMIHPSQQTGPHTDYKRWVETSVSTWKDMLSQRPASPVYKACAELFKEQYEQLRATVDALPTFESLLDVLPQVIGETRLLQVNSTPQGERDVKWRENEYWILIGGQKLDRGFTVEGLTVTYMPRDIGTGNADTVQQRARFFGYKRSYRGLCRVFVSQDVADALTQYVEHEEDVRSALVEYQGRPLMEWKRHFILTRALNATRSSVVGLDIEHVSLDEGWTAPGWLYNDDDACSDNRTVFNEVIKSWSSRFGDEEAQKVSARFKDERVDSPRNILISGVPMSEVLKELVLRVRAADVADSTELAAIAIALRVVLEADPGALCDVFVIGEMSPQLRSITATGRINQLAMGENPSGVRDIDQLRYVGDRALYTEQRLSVHLRSFNLRASKSDSPFVQDVPWYAFRLPQSMTKDVIVERRR
jgi:hypothetical protein